MLTKTTDRMTSGGMVNVLDYGAVGDGVTDDTTAIQTAIDTGLTVSFPDGTYFVADVGGTLIDRKGTLIGRCLLLNNAGQRLELGNAKIVCDPTVVNNTTVFGVTAKDVTIMGGEITNVVAETTPASAGTSGIIINALNCRVLGLKASCLSSELILAGAGGNYALIDDCDLYDNENNTLTFFGSTGSKACNSVMSGGTDGNCTTFGSSYDCVFENNTYYGNRRNGSVSTTTQLCVLESSRQCAIIGCTFDGQGATGRGKNGPIINRSRQCTIADNLIRDVHNGIIIRETDVAGAGGIHNLAHVVTGNVVQNLYEKNAGSDVYGILLEYGAACNISSNTFLMTKAGVAEQSSAVAAYEIYIRNAGTYAINTDADMHNLNITGNTFVQVKANEGGTKLDGFLNLPIPVLTNATGLTLEALTFSNNKIISRSTTAACIDIGANDLSSATIVGNTVQSNNTGSLANRPFLVTTGSILYSTIANNTCLANAANGINWLSCGILSFSSVTGNTVVDTNGGNNAWVFINTVTSISYTSIVGNTVGADTLVNNAGATATNVVAYNTGRNNNAGTAWVIGVVNGVSGDIVNNAVV